MRTEYVTFDDNIGVDGEFNKKKKVINAKPINIVAEKKKVINSKPIDIEVEKKPEGQVEAKSKTTDGFVNFMKKRRLLKEASNDEARAKRMEQYKNAGLAEFDR